MARKENKSYFMHFDLTGYEKALRRAIYEAMFEAKKRLKQMAKINISLIPFKENKVRLAGDLTTSDAQRKAAVLNSIIEDDVKTKGYYAYTTAIQALANNFKDSHIGIYYEYGTGVYAEDSEFPLDLGDPNPERHGKDIVSRSKNVSYSGGLGMWRDMGGNLRVTGSPKGGVRDSKFIKYVGDDIHAYHWFRNATRDFENEFDDILVKAVCSVNPLDYLNMRGKFTLGVD